MSHRALNDEQFEDHLPEPGKAPIPEGHVRLFHYTSPENVANIAQHGLQQAHARGSTYGEPNMVWAAAGVPKREAFYNKSFVEFHAHPQHDLDIGALYGRVGRRGDPADTARAVEHSQHLESHQAHVTMQGDVPPERIVGIHEPWHAHVRYLEESPSTREMYTTGDFKAPHTTGDPDSDRALAYVRAKHARGGYK